VYFTKIAPNCINALALRKISTGIALTLRNIEPKKNYFFWRNGFIAQAQTWRNPSA